MAFFLPCLRARFRFLPVCLLGLFLAFPSASRAVSGGRNALTLNGQVQIYVNGIYACTGSLISPEWVLTALHCMTDTGGSAANTDVYLGSAQLGAGEYHALSEYFGDIGGDDAAVLRLAEPTQQLDQVARYGVTDPTVGDVATVQGWGLTQPNGPPASVLQTSTHNVIASTGTVPGVGPAADILALQTLQGRTQPGDSGAGAFVRGLVCGVQSHAQGFDGPYSFAVKSNALSAWITTITGVPPGGICRQPSLKRTIKVMSLGDRITQGIAQGSPDAYRAQFYSGLVNTGLQVTMVGSNSNGNAPSDKWEGAPSDQADDLRKDAQCAVPNQTPDMVLVEAGEEAIYLSQDNATEVSKIDTLITTIEQAAPGVTILVASLPPNQSVSLNEATTEFNQTLQTRVLQHKNAGEHVDYVDLGSLTLDDVVDNPSDRFAVPTAAGYLKVGDAFAVAAETAVSNGWLDTPPSFNYGQCPNPPAPPAPPPSDPNAPPAGADPLPPFTPGETGTRRPDPSAIYTNGVYYSVESNEDTNPAQDTIYLREASSLAGLASATPSPVYTDQAGLGELWAPEIMYINNSFYVYFTMGAGSAHRMYVISSPLAHGGYTAAQKLALPDDACAIDGTTFVYQGQRWFAWSGWPGTTNGEQDIYLAKMSDPVTPTGPRYQISQPHETWEQASGTSTLVNEGVEAILDPNGQLHIVYSANGSWTDQYCLGDLRLQANGDPSYVWDWHKVNGCLFGSNGGNMEPDGWYPTLYADGPGHHSFVLPDGDINQSPHAAYPATAQFLYHAVPKGLNYEWANRVRYVGAYTWYNNINYNRCCVPGTNVDTGYSLMFFEDPQFTPNPPPSGPPPGGGTGGAAIPGATGIHNADPSVIRVGAGTFYSVETWNNETAIAMRQASSPQALGAATPTVLFQYSQGTNAIWAPEISLIDGYYYVYFSADIGAGHRMFWARFTTDWVPAGGQQLNLPDDQWAVDGNTFMFNGQRWFVWSGTEDDDPNEQNLYLVKMSDPTTPTGPRYRISQPHETWERASGGPPNNYINEAPAPIVDPSGQLHIVYSANGSWTDQYCLADLRLRAGGDPTYVWDWYKSNGCEFGSHSETMMQGWDPTLYVDGPGSHSFVLLNGDVATSPVAGAKVPLMYHAVPKGTPYSWDARQWFAGEFQWYAASVYTRCCVPGDTSSSGWGIKFYEDPHF